MPSAERKSRNQRHTALTCALMAEVALGTTVLVWSSRPTSADQAILGPTGSRVAVIAAMVLLAMAAVLLLPAPRLPRRVLVIAVVLLSLVIAVVGVIAIALLTTEPGIGWLLAVGWLLTIPLSLEIRRASGPRTRPSNTRQG